MDHMMPEMDGVEAMKRIRQAALSSGRSPVIIALTANALSGAREMFLREGFDGFIAKPIDTAEFERVMKRVLPEEPEVYNGPDQKREDAV
jgi:CheY-like chemotaxis protein